jgi:hypothetical protein
MPKRRVLACLTAVIAGAWLLAAARPSLDVVEIPRREVLVARFKGHPLLSPYKVYPVMAKWMAGHGLQPAGPAVEFYRDGIVECELPVAPAADPEKRQQSSLPR